MLLPHFKTITEQVAEDLRDELLSGHWQDGIPGQKACGGAGTDGAVTDALLLENLLVLYQPGRERIRAESGYTMLEQGSS